jgi:hypothetical protein
MKPGKKTIVMKLCDVITAIINGIRSAGVVGRFTKLPILPVKSQVERIA